MARNTHLTHLSAIHQVNPLTGQMQVLPDNSEQWTFGMQYSYDPGTSLLQWISQDDMAFAWSRLGLFIGHGFASDFNGGVPGGIFNTAVTSIYLREAFAKKKDGINAGADFVFIKGSMCMMYRAVDPTILVTAVSSYGPGYQAVSWMTFQDDLHCYH